MGMVVGVVDQSRTIVYSTCGECLALKSRTKKFLTISKNLIVPTDHLGFRFGSFWLGQ